MNMMKMMKQAAGLQKNMQKVQEDLAQQELESQSGGGAVVVRITGSGDVLGIRIDPKAVSADDVEMLEDLLVTAVQGAQEKAKETAAEAMRKVTAGMGLPPGLGF